MVEFGGNNPGKNESPEEFNHRTSLKYNTFVLNDACKFQFCFTKMCGRQNPGKRTDLMKSSTIESFSNIASTCCMMRAKLWICLQCERKISFCTFELVVLTSVAEWIEWANLNKVLKNIHTDYQNVVTETLKTSGGDAGKWTRSRCFWENKIVENTICKPTNNVCAWSPGTAETINVVALKYINILNILNTSRLQHM